MIQAADAGIGIVGKEGKQVTSFKTLSQNDFWYHILNVVDKTAKV